MPFVATRVELEGIILNEVSQKKKDKYHGVTYMQNNIKIPSKESDKDFKNQPFKTDHSSEGIQRGCGGQESATDYDSTVDAQVVEKLWSPHLKGEILYWGGWQDVNDPNRAQTPCEKNDGCGF